VVFPFIKQRLNWLGHVMCRGESFVYRGLTKKISTKIDLEEDQRGWPNETSYGPPDRYYRANTLPLKKDWDSNLIYWWKSDIYSGENSVIYHKSTYAIMPRKVKFYWILGSYKDSYQYITPSEITITRTSRLTA